LKIGDGFRVFKHVLKTWSGIVMIVLYVASTILDSYSTLLIYYLCRLVGVRFMDVSPIVIVLLEVFRSSPQLFILVATVYALAIYILSIFFLSLAFAVALGGDFNSYPRKVRKVFFIIMSIPVFLHLFGALSNFVQAWHIVKHVLHSSPLSVVR